MKGVSAVPKWRTCKCKVCTQQRNEADLLSAIIKIKRLEALIDRNGGQFPYPMRTMDSLWRNVTWPIAARVSRRLYKEKLTRMPIPQKYDVKIVVSPTDEPDTNVEVKLLHIDRADIMKPNYGVPIVRTLVDQLESSVNFGEAA
jgi:hypothetical protein